MFRLRFLYQTKAREQTAEILLLRVSRLSPAGA
jgi:hypothetical protein